MWISTLCNPDPIRQWRDGQHHFFHEATEPERRAFIYWDMYEFARRIGMVEEREKYWESYLFWRRRSLGGEL